MDLTRRSSMMRFVDAANASAHAEPTQTALDEALLFYRTLSDSPKALPAGLSDSDLLYARYFWLNRYLLESERIHGFDAGLRQQAWQLLEQSPVPLDWSRVEALDARAAAGDC